MKKDWKELIHAYTLKNAIDYDKALANSVLNHLFREGLKKEEIREIMPLIQQEVKKVNSMSKEEILAKFGEYEKKFNKIEKEKEEKQRHGLPELENAKGKIVLRFSPAPSGPLHIGNVSTAVLNSLYAKKYKGKFYVRIEDTNPENIYPQAYKMIQEECDWLFDNVTKYTVQSKDLKKYYKTAEELIKKDAAYVCECESEKHKELVDKSRACPCRSLDIKENIKRWGKMLSKGKDSYKEGQAVLRFKSNLNDPNPALRDFPLARINLAKHPKQGNKYRVWPLMNLAVTVDDIEIQVTHAIRGKDHMDNAKRQEMIYKILNKKSPITIFTGKYNFTDLDLSKTKTKKLIQEKKFTGWDDIRLPFVDSLRKRGYQPESFAKMAEQRGISEVDKVISSKDYFEILDNFNRDILRNKTRKIEYDFSKRTGFKEYSLLMPNNEKKKIYVENKVKDNEIVFFSNLGYAKLNKDVFWFAHK